MPRAPTFPAPSTRPAEPGRGFWESMAPCVASLPGCNHSSHLQALLGFMLSPPSRGKTSTTVRPSPSSFRTRFGGGQAPVLATVSSVALKRRQKPVNHVTTRTCSRHQGIVASSSDTQAWPISSTAASASEGRSTRAALKASNSSSSSCALSPGPRLPKASCLAARASSFLSASALNSADAIAAVPGPAAAVRQGPREAGAP
mmetsp:Transcript_114205/g.354555  ORF Transcript_114205/g.354555 Transcript_114205/m.354555 type:complete len:202 (+) Transcript_114205:1465-2070(+)